MEDVIGEGCLGPSDNKEFEFQMLGVIRKKAHLCLQAGEQRALKLFFLSFCSSQEEKELWISTLLLRPLASLLLNFSINMASRMTSTNLAICTGPNLLSPPRRTDSPWCRRWGR